MSCYSCLLATSEHLHSKTLCECLAILYLCIIPLTTKSIKIHFHPGESNSLKSIEHCSLKASCACVHVIKSWGGFACVLQAPIYTLFQFFFLMFSFKGIRRLHSSKCLCIFSKDLCVNGVPPFFHPIPTVQVHNICTHYASKINEKSCLSFAFCVLIIFWWLSAAVLFEGTLKCSLEFFRDSEVTLLKK